MKKQVEFNEKTEDKRKIYAKVLTRPPIIRACKMHSKKISNCLRKDEGSFSHFANYAILKVLRDDFGIDFERVNPEEYKINKINIDKAC